VQTLENIGESDRVHLQHDLVAAIDDFIGRIKLARRTYDFQGPPTDEEGRQRGRRLSLEISVHSARDLGKVVTRYERRCRRLSDEAISSATSLHEQLVEEADRL
jgi:hypothetical protein